MKKSLARTIYPRISIRLTHKTETGLKELALRERRKPSELARLILQDYLATAVAKARL